MKAIEQYSKRALRVVLGRFFLCLWLSGCSYYETLPNQRQQAPVEVRRGTVSGPQTAYARPAPTINRPVYVPDQRPAKQRSPSGAEQGYSEQGYSEQGYSSDAEQGYTTTPDNTDAEHVQDGRYSGYEAPPSINNVGSPPAIARLVAQAESAIQNEDYATAAARAESALRLDPQSVAAYQTLARTYLFEGRYAESEQMALRAQSYARQDPTLEQTTRHLWLLIAETRRSRGDQQGAEQAMQSAGGRHE